MAIQDDKTILNKGDLKAYHQKILPYLGGNMMMSTNNSDYYSTDEKVVGVWTDGKPIYQKTYGPFLTTPYTTSGRNWVDLTDLTSLNIDTVVSISGTILTNNSVRRSLPFIDQGKFECAVVYMENVQAASNPKHLKALIMNEGSGASYSDIYATIQYTKTTDTAGSATTTPGAYDINFPNTWKENTEIYFGNGLYGYRQVRTTPSTPRTQYPIIAGVKKIVSYGGTEFRNSDGYGHPIGCATSSPATSSDNAYPYLYIEGATMTSGTGTLSIWGADVGMKGWDVWATYTK